MSHMNLSIQGTIPMNTPHLSMKLMNIYLKKKRQKRRIILMIFMILEHLENLNNTHPDLNNYSLPPTLNSGVMYMYLNDPYAYIDDPQ